jgi:hypothetical protein
MSSCTVAPQSPSNCCPTTATSYRTPHKATGLNPLPCLLLVTFAKPCRWGAAYALNREHSDLLTLKRLLLGDKVDSLYAMLDESYNR